MSAWEASLEATLEEDQILLKRRLDEDDEDEDFDFDDDEDEDGDDGEDRGADAANEDSTAE